MTQIVKHRTLIGEKQTFEVSVTAVSFIEPVTNSDHFFVGFYFETSMELGILESPTLKTEATYLMGTLEGLDQVIKVEAPDEPAAVRMCALFHEVAVTAGNEMKHVFIALTLQKLVESL